MRSLPGWLACLGVMAIVSTRAHADATRGPSDTESVRAFVQEFYDWYGTAVLKGPPGAPWRRVRRERESSFSPRLIRALDEDAAAQAAVPGATVGLDFDPFVASQDPDDRHQVGPVTRRGNVYFAEVHGVRGGDAREDAAVVELDGSNGHWRFRDFHYQRGRHLLGVLDSLRDAREATKRGPRTESAIGAGVKSCSETDCEVPRCLRLGETCFNACHSDAQCPAGLVCVCNDGEACTFKELLGRSRRFDHVCFTGFTLRELQRLPGMQRVVPDGDSSSP